MDFDELGRAYIKILGTASLQIFWGKTIVILNNFFNLVFKSDAA